MAFDNNFMEIENMIPVPAMKLDKDGKIESANSLIGEVFLYDDIRGGDIFALARIKCSQLKDAVEKGIHIEIDRNTSQSSGREHGRRTFALFYRYYS